MKAIFRQVFDEKYALLIDGLRFIFEFVKKYRKYNFKIFFEYVGATSVCCISQRGRRIFVFSSVNSLMFTLFLSAFD